MHAPEPFRADLERALARLEAAWVELGRAQEAGKRGNRERQAMVDAYARFWLVFGPLATARQREIRRARRVTTRLLAALISLG